jgi:hypothetical protein
MPTANSPGQLELASEAFLEASLDCHRWKVRFMDLARPTPQTTGSGFEDIWDYLTACWIPEYSEAEYQRFLPLFCEGLDMVQRRFERLSESFSDVLPPEFRAHIVRAQRQLDLEQEVYKRLRYFAPDLDGLFRYRFVEVIRVLRGISRDADRRREALTRSAEHHDCASKVRPL